MPHWVDSLLPYVFPVLVAGLTSGIGIVGSTPKRLRRELSVETEVLERISGPAAVPLQRAVEAKAIRLAAWNRYPAFFGFDAVRLVLLAVFSTTGALYLVLALRNREALAAGTARDYSSMAMCAVGGIALWFWLASNWMQRSYKRTLNIRRELDEEHWDERDYTQIVEALVWYFLGVFAFFPSVAAMIATWSAQNNHEVRENAWVTIFTAIAGAVVVLTVIAGPVRFFLKTVRPRSKPRRVPLFVKLLQRLDKRPRSGPAEQPLSSPGEAETDSSSITAP